MYREASESAAIHSTPSNSNSFYVSLRNYCSKKVVQTPYDVCVSSSIRCHGRIPQEVDKPSRLSYTEDSLACHLLLLTRTRSHSRTTRHPTPRQPSSSIPWRTMGTSFSQQVISCPCIVPSAFIKTAAEMGAAWHGAADSHGLQYSE